MISFLFFLSSTSLMLQLGNVCNVDNYSLPQAQTATTGTTIFSSTYIKRAIDESEYRWEAEDFTNAEGFCLNHSYGGELIPFTKTGSDKYGFVDKKGKVVVPMIYDDYIPSDYEETILAAVFLYDDDRVIKDDDGFIHDSFCMGFIDMKGHLIVPCQYSTVISGSDLGPELMEFNGAWWLKTIDIDGNRKFGCIDKTGKIVVPFIYDATFINEEDMSLVFVKGDTQFLFDKSWNIIETKAYSPFNN